MQKSFFVFVRMVAVLLMMQSGWLAAEQTAAPKPAEHTLHFRQGQIDIGNGLATLQIPDAFVFLDPQDAEWVLRTWGNPVVKPPLGMVMPSGISPFAPGSWAVTVDFEEHGYISDEDADKIDYDELLSSMQADVEKNNVEREKGGYAPIHLLGWAVPPHYDAEGKKLYWAKTLTFGGQSQPILNYNIRLLGRKGVLVLNFVAGMEQLPEIERNLDAVLAMAVFNPGQRYIDFNPELDKVAAYGLGALVAGKVAAKLGLLAVVLAFLKKFWILPVLVIGWLWRNIRKKKNDTF